VVNDLLPTNVDTDNDSLHQVMNLLSRLDKGNRKAYVDSVLLKVKSGINGTLGKILNDKAMADALLNLFRYEHFRCKDNLGAGMSMRNIASWYPAISGVSANFVRPRETRPLTFRETGDDQDCQGLYSPWWNYNYKL